jgi:hypothetical protein
MITSYKIFESRNKDIISNLQSYLKNVLWIDIKFKDGVGDLSYKFNLIYSGQSLVPGRNYKLAVSKREGIEGYFIISGNYQVNDEGEKKRLDITDGASYALLYTPYQFLQLLKYVDKEYLEKIEILMSAEKYNL